MKLLQGRVALVTGAGRGFGLAIAEAFIENGAEVILHYRATREPCERLIEHARSLGQGATALQADFANPDSVSNFAAGIARANGAIDILVNNAGIMCTGSFVDEDESEWSRQLSVNVLGPLRVTRIVAPGMMERGWGKIINISSQLALRAWDQGAVYAGTKGFVLSWTKSLAMELGPAGIRVNAIGPGSIVTDMNREVFPDSQSVAAKAAELPLRYMGSPSDVAGCAVFLASSASDFMTGQMLGINGGSHM